MSPSLTYQQSGHHQYRCGTVGLHEVTKHQVAHDGPQSGRDQRHCHGGGAERRGEELYTQTVQAVETHGGDSTEDTRQNEVHGGAVHQVDEEGRGAAEQHREAQEELPAEFVHVEDGPDVGGGGRQGDDEAVDEDLIVGDTGGTMRALISGGVQLDLQAHNLMQDASHHSTFVVRLQD